MSRMICRVPIDFDWPLGEVWPGYELPGNDFSGPPEGPAYQVWETVSSGSPISPPFLTPEDLARWMVDHDNSYTSDVTYEEWIVFIREIGSAVSFGHGMSGVKASACAGSGLTDSYDPRLRFLFYPFNNFFRRKIIMTGKWTLFSEVLSQLTAEEEKWLRHEFEHLYGFDGKAYAEGAVPENCDIDEADWHSFRWYLPGSEFMNRGNPTRKSHATARFWTIATQGAGDNTCGSTTTAPAACTVTLTQLRPSYKSYFNCFALTSAGR